VVTDTPGQNDKKEAEDTKEEYGWVWEKKEMKRNCILADMGCLSRKSDLAQYKKQVHIVCRRIQATCSEKRRDKGE